MSIYVHESLPPPKVWKELEDDQFETKWLTIQPRRLPREYSLIIVVGVYHPPSAPNGPMIRHLQINLETILQKHPNAGILMGGDTNHLNLRSLIDGFKLKQIVTCKTRGDNTLDVILTNMADFYKPPIAIGALGRSDHEMVLAVPITPPKWEPPKRITTVSRNATHEQKVQVAEALRSVPWELMYRLPDCKSQFDFFQGILTDTLDTLVPTVTKSRLSNDKPWVTPEYKSLIARRQAAFISGNTPLYNKLRNLQFLVLHILSKHNAECGEWNF